MEPRLQYNNQLQRWEGETYYRHLRAYCEQQGISDRHSAEAQAAHQHCLRLDFWQNCTDPDVHVRYFGQAAIERMQRQEPDASNGEERTPPCS
jgi:hypothetical protein